jgi:uncharacterized protein YbjT (DUF2867 family)
MGRAVVIGAAGQIGRPAVEALARDGWEVTAASRGGARDEGWPDEVRAVRLDREDDATSWSTSWHTGLGTHGS